MTIWFASGNSHKKAELAAILNAQGDVQEGRDLPRSTRSFTEKEKNITTPCTPWFNILIPSDAGLDFDPEETGTTFYENALLKARELYSLLEKSRHGVNPPPFKPGDPIIADDSGICVDALGGRPGIYSARYAGANGENAPNAQQLESTQRNRLLLEELDGVHLRTARFVCAMALLFSPDRFYVAQETFEGEIVSGMDAAKGGGGFGYDPILFIPDLGRTVAELSDDEKNTISHRAKAGKIIANLLRNYA
ncbi:MAG: non-canonical purine NTP pyrophosphatase [Treponema sp.]|jgi:XTP/dITP diphosphohydrolase|nr:non-canonical purine NTP pyrophosphatase [Treponema sp.]